MESRATQKPLVCGRSIQENYFSSSLSHREEKTSPVQQYGSIFFSNDPSIMTAKKLQENTQHIISSPQKFYLFLFFLKKLVSASQEKISDLNVWSKKSFYVEEEKKEENQESVADFIADYDLALSIINSDKSSLPPYRATTFTDNLSASIQKKTPVEFVLDYFGKEKRIFFK